MAAQCNQRRFEFHGVFRRHVVAKFDRGAVAAAVSVVGTTEEITAPRLPSLVEKVKATAAAISEVLRGNPPE